MNQKPKIVAAIFARGGSKGVPRKNIKMLGDKPLIAYSIEVALSVEAIDRVVVSTDDEEIAAVARKYGAEVPFMRPTELAQDNSPEWLSWQHLIEALQQEHPIDILVSVPATSPFRNRNDVEKCIQALVAHEDTDVVITVTEAHRNPYFNMVTLDPGGRANLVMQGKETIARRQDAPEVYDMTTVAYAANVPFIMEANSVFDGRMRAVIVPPERALDIDTSLDFAFAEFILRSKD
ncbi:MAG: acylneuraminate cytidylyltransferase family protein [Anaerolineales bacterium]|nr:acylneuraminate cytidylyltransferase family protein [Anaerolineales bacterium]